MYDILPLENRLGGIRGKGLDLNLGNIGFVESCNLFRSGPFLFGAMTKGQDHGKYRYEGGRV